MEKFEQWIETADMFKLECVRNKELGVTCREFWELVNERIKHLFLLTN